MQILLQTQKGTEDITQLVPSAKWSGDLQQVVRTLMFSLLSSTTDKSIPVIDAALGANVQLLEAGEVVFYGSIVSRTKSTEGNTIDITCFDHGWYLKRNKTIKTYSKKRPEEIAQALAAEFNIPVGYLEPTGIALSRHFLTGTSIADIIVTVYNLAARETGKQYHFGFRGPDLYVTEKKVDDRTLIIAGKSNLIAANTTESIENLVSAVQIFDANGKFVRELTDGGRLQEYGRLQEVIRQTKGDNKAAEAQKLLDDGGVSQKITVDCLGNVANVTGGAVVVQEPHTGLYGLFYIDSDTHEWKRGQYYNKLTLNYKSTMTEKEAGSLPNASGTKTAGKATATTKWNFAHGYKEGNNDTG